jgi:GntR family transcriptional regulator / MocR family aminotransferase
MWLSDKLTVIGAEAGMHLVTLLSRGVNDVAISLRAAEMGISAMPLSSCYAQPPLVGGLILGYGGTDARQIQDGIRRLAMCI